ncbi:MAG: type II toxin-antitoxin system MqsA family antitoxin [Desulfuromonadales bacterium]
MKCVICKHGETKSGFATVTFASKESTIVVKRVPADICQNCGEEYVSSNIASDLFISAEEATSKGVELDVRHYLMAA